MIRKNVKRSRKEEQRWFMADHKPEGTKKKPHPGEKQEKQNRGASTEILQSLRKGKMINNNEYNRHEER